MARPWMPLYVADYLRDTRRLTAAEHGAYLLLIMEYWTAGGLPDDDRLLARIACMSSGEWKKARANVQALFHDGWKHKRIDAELARSADISSKRAASAKQKYSKSSANAEQEDTHAGAYSQSPSPSPEDSPSLRSGETRAKSSKSSKGSRIDPEWVLDSQDREKAKELGLSDRDAEWEAAKFKDWALQARDAVGVKKNWRSAWANWCRGAVEKRGVSLGKADCVAFSALPGTPQFETWRTHFRDTNSRFMLARMERAREENKPVELDGEWPPGFIRTDVSHATIPNAQGRGS